MEHIWFRVGMKITFTDEDYARIIGGGIVPSDILNAIKEGRAVPDGETYAPVENDLPYDTEINVCL